MNYRHIYHAGSFTDVFKHLIQIALMQTLQQKPVPFCYLDTHAGIGLYHLQSEAALKTNEANTGILKIMPQDNLPELVQAYLACVQAVNLRFATNDSDNNLTYYPGSPLVADYFARTQDKIIACELHPDDYQALKNLFIHNKSAAIHHMNGYHALKAFLPPLEKRGLILIDPPYEQLDEWSHLLNALRIALKHFANGVYAIWYPYKDAREVKRWQQELSHITDLPILNIEFMLRDAIPQVLCGCGMMIINPPWQLEQKLKPSLSWLINTLKINDEACYRFLKTSLPD